MLSLKRLLFLSVIIGAASAAPANRKCPPRTNTINSDKLKSSPQPLHLLQPFLTVMLPSKSLLLLRHLQPPPLSLEEVKVLFRPTVALLPPSSLVVCSQCRPHPICIHCSTSHQRQWLQRSTPSSHHLLRYRTHCDRYPILLCFQAYHLNSRTHHDKWNGLHCQTRFLHHFYKRCRKPHLNSNSRW
ncbi:hypothetical protein BC829DRAFT_150583 [Chytridium lagenaria]|nr:hypothetical protein BC829DRAFT_150583 [Chytridium lagenaria]